MDLISLIGASKFRPNRLASPDAWVGHIPFGAWLVKTLKPGVMVELGTHSGNSYFSFCQAVKESELATRCYAVDTWLGDEQAGYYGDDVFNDVNSYNQANYAAFSRLLRMTFDDALNCFGDASIDLLHIDGLHTYEAVKNDFDSWLPKLSPSAVILFHDTNVRGQGFGVWRLWEELAQRYPLHIEFVHSHGLGVLRLADEETNSALEWLHEGVSAKDLIVSYFATLGADVAEQFTKRQLEDHVAHLNTVLAEREQQIYQINQAVSERDGRITSLDQAVSERDGRITSLDQAVAERDGRITSLDQAVAERDGRITSLDQLIADRGGQIASLTRTLSEAITERDALLSSTIWRSTWLLRVVTIHLRSLHKKVRRSKWREHGSLAALHDGSSMQDSGNRIERAQKRLYQTDKMLCLMIDAQWPQPSRDSGSVDAMFMAETLRDLGYSVIFTGITEYVADPSLREPLLSVGIECLDSSVYSSIDDFLIAEGSALDLVILFRSPCGGHYFEVVRRECRKARVIFNTVDLHGLREHREACLHGNRSNMALASQQWEREMYLTRQADATIVVSQYEADLLLDTVPGANVVVLPLAREIPGTNRGYQDRTGIGFIGGFRHLPNIDALSYFLREIWPTIISAIPDCEFLIVGANLPQDIQSELPPQSRYLGQLDEIGPWFDGLRLTVAPLRYGAGVKGKVASSLAHGVPCVLTMIAAEGMGLTPGQQVLIADEPISFANAVIRLFNDRELWERLSDASVAFAQKELSHEIGKCRIEQMLQAINFEVSLPELSDHPLC